MPRLAERSVMLDHILQLVLAAGAGMSLWLLARLLAGGISGLSRKLPAVLSRAERILSGRG